MRARTLVLAFLLCAAALPPPAAHAEDAYTYTAYEFGPDSNGNVWNIWSANGSNKWDWHHDYVNGFLHYRFKIFDYHGGYWCSGSCTKHVVWTKNPTHSFTPSDLARNTFLFFPENNENDHTYTVDIQWNPTGYHESVYDETAGEPYQNGDYDYVGPVTPTTYDAFTYSYLWDFVGPVIYRDETPADHASNFYSHVYGEEGTGTSGGGGDIRTEALPVMQNVGALATDLYYHEAPFTNPPSYIAGPDVFFNKNDFPATTTVGSVEMYLYTTDDFAPSPTFSFECWRYSTPDFGSIIRSAVVHSESELNQTYTGAIPPYTGTHVWRHGLIHDDNPFGDACTLAGQDHLIVKIRSESNYLDAIEPYDGPDRGIGFPWGRVTAFVRGAVASSVLFLPGIEASRLYTRDTPLSNEHQLWEPTLYTDLPPLALNADGSSKAQIYTKDIVDSIQAHNRSASTIAGLFDTLEVYGTFEQFMDGLVATGTIKEWRAYPYDWRYDVFDIVQNGTLTEQPDGSITRVYLADVLKQMASNSATGKVTIVAHSNGGLLAKALAITLGADAPKYIDRIIMIGTPQYGTPSSIGALLHADNFADIPSLIINQAAARAVASTMPGAFGLLPAPAYFARIADPVATFDATSLAGKYAESYGATTTNYSALANFLSDPAHLDATVGDPGALTTPLALSPTLLQKAQATHAQLDAWTPPSGIAVTAIAGWGQKTLKTLAYTTGTKYSCDSVSGVFSCGVRQVLEHAPVNTQDGDDTVIDASALGDTAGKAYFDTSAFFHATRKNIVHQNLTAASPIQNIVESILEGKNSLGSFISSTRPPGGLNPITIISTRSPVNIVATDASGNRTGILPMPGTDFTGLLEDVPGSSVQTFGDEEYLYLPAGGSYTISMQAYAGGYATLNVGAEQADGSASTTVSFRNIPLIASTTATFSVSNGTVGAVSVDEDGNGSSDFTYTPGAPVLSPTQLIAYLRSYISTLSAAQGVKTDLGKALDKVAASLGSKKGVLRGALSNLQSLINAQSGKQITQAQALFMLQLVGLLSP